METQGECLSNIQLNQYTENTLTDKKQFWEECIQIRQQGYAFDNEESNLGLSCLAVPILDSRGKAVAAISTSGQTRSVVARKEEILAKLREVQQLLAPYL